MRNTLSLVLLYTLGCWAQSGPAARLATEIPALMEKAEVPGVGVAVIESGRVSYVHSFGVKSAATKQPVDERTVFEAASLTKPVVAYAALKLAGQGKLDLDKPLSDYLAAPYIQDARLGQITARRVLTHTTGFPNWRPDGKPLVTVFAPGERFSYSGEGFVYLGFVMERITGTLLDRLVAQLVFEPLGMKDSSLVWEKPFDQQSATGHTEAGVPRTKGRPLQPNAAASMQTTAADYARFMIALMNGTGLKPELARAMISTQTQVDNGCANCVGRPVTKPSETIAWGLGVGIQHTASGESFWHWGDNGGFRCLMAGYPAQKKGVIVFTNSANGLAIAPRIAELALGEKLPASAWVSYASYDSPIFQVRRAFLKDSLEAGVNLYRQAAKNITESDMNTLGYTLLGMKKNREAIEVFKLNVDAFPKSANCYDSLGEAYMTNGDKELAIANYEKSVELEPKNEGGKEALKKLRAQ